MDGCHFFPLGFIKKQYLFPLGFINFDVLFLSVLSKSSIFFLSVLSKILLNACMFQRKYLLLHLHNNE